MSQKSTASSGFQCSEEGFRLLGNSLSTAGYFMIHRALIQRLGFTVAGVLHYLINYQTRMMNSRRRKYKWKRGWFFCMVKTMQEDLRLSQEVQSRIIGLLSDQFFIETKRKGIPPRRFIRINNALVLKIIQEWKPNTGKFGIKNRETLSIKTREANKGKSGSFNPGVSGSIPSTKDPDGSIKKNSMSEPDGSDGECVSDASTEGGDRRKGKRVITSFDLKAASELHRVVSSHIKVNCRADNKQWANQFRMMREVDKIPKQDIRRAIEWYGQNIGKEFMVEAFSGAAFRQKYMNGQIPAAMKREWAKENGNGEVPSDKQQLRERVSQWLWEEDLVDDRNCWTTQEKLDALLVSHGLEAGCLLCNDVGY